MLIRHLQKCIPREIFCKLPTLPEGTRTDCGEDLCIIAVVGAGASAPIKKRATDLIEHLKSQLHIDNKRHQQKIERIARRTGLKKEHFETQLLALTETPEQEKTVRDEICKQYKVPHPTLLAYELVAHLLKHRYLDAVVSFNFDELLDRSIADELGEHDYRRIISDRDCVYVSENPDSPDYLPLFIKPHGTASEPQSLRFTLDAYDELPDRISKLLCAVLGTAHCIVINVGFGLESFEFNQLLVKPHKLTIYNLSKDRINEEATKQIDEYRREMKYPNATILDVLWKKDKDKKNEASREADKQLDALLQDLETIAKDESGKIAEFRMIDRHRLTSRLLNWQAQDIQDENELYARYLRDRAILEISYSALRARGLISLFSLVTDRGAKYYNDYQSVMRKVGLEPELWHDLCEKGGLKLSPLSMDSYESVFSVREQSSKTTNPQVRLEELDRLRIDVAKLAVYVKRSLDDRTQTNFRKVGKDVERALDEFKVGTGFEATSQIDSVCRKLFRSPTILPTLTSLRAAVISLLCDNDVDELAIISEDGHWLLDDPYINLILKRKTPFKINLIIAFKLHMDDICKQSLDNISIKWITSHWWRLNRRMTIAYADGKPIGGVYFTRMHRSLFVTPVYLKASQDLKFLATTFQVYWTRSRMMARALKEDDIPAIPTLKDLDVTNLIDRRYSGKGGDHKGATAEYGENRRRNTDRRKYDGVLGSAH